MAQPPLPGRQSLHHVFAGLFISGSGRSLQHNEQEPHDLPVRATSAAIMAALAGSSVLTALMTAPSQERRWLPSEDAEERS
jgi:hypothetical protein